MTLSSRINAIERKVISKLTPVEEMLCENERFAAMLQANGIDIDDLKRNRNVLGGLPREMLQLMVERLKVKTSY